MAAVPLLWAWAAWACLCVVNAIDIYLDEFKFQDELPGNDADERTFPNSPFTVDPNRLNDGVSSVHPLSSTSPSFPFSTAETQPTDWRRDHAKQTANSAVQQGVAAPGEGEEMREIARKKATQFGRSAKNGTFAVEAATLWNPSNFAVQKGETYRIDVVGEQFWLDGAIKIDANGYEAEYDAVAKCYVAVGKCRSYLKQRLRMPNARWFTLSCGIGNFVWKLSEIIDGHDHYMPLREDDFVDSCFAVGRTLTFEAKHTGELACFANDGHGLYWNNAGSLTVTATRVSWPPEGDYYYHDDPNDTGAAETEESYVADEQGPAPTSSASSPTDDDDALTNSTNSTAAPTISP